jgi:hypothetical protein
MENENKLLKDLEREQNETKKKIEILNFFKISGTSDKIRYILIPLDKNPLVCMEVKTLKELKELLNTYKNEMLSFYIEKSGTTGIKPLTPFDVFEESKYKTLVKSKFYFETQPDKHGRKDIKIVFFLQQKPQSENYFKIWVDCPLNVFKEGEDYIYKQKVDPFETKTAREYRRNHPDIYMRVPFFKGLESIEFWGGYIYFYALSDDEEKHIYSLMLWEV